MAKVPPPPPLPLRAPSKVVRVLVVFAGDMVEEEAATKFWNKAAKLDFSSPSIGFLPTWLAMAAEGEKEGVVEKEGGGEAEEEQEEEGEKAVRAKELSRDAGKTPS